MPTVLRVGSLRIVIYPNDHSPPHVHVTGPDGEAKIELGDSRVKPRIAQNEGLMAKQLAAVLKVIDDERELLHSKWREIHENR
jgi:Domain of unknown function (DUF4160)